MVGVADERDQLIAELRAEVAGLREMVALLQAQVEDLKRQLRQNSSNSNKPPSSDGPGEREARRGREPSGRPRGGQPGHKGSRRVAIPPEKVNRAVTRFPERCRRCHEDLPQTPLGAPLIHQVVEVPQIQPDVTEYRLHRVRCSCGKVTCAALPPGVPRGMCGPRLMALMGLLVSFKLSRRDVVQLLGDLLGIRISLGAVSEAEEVVSEAVAAPVEEARVYVSKNEPSKNSDGTSWRESGKARALWVVAAPLVTVFTITTDATRAAVRGVFAAVSGILMSDRGRQFDFWAMDKRQICWAHLIRKFASFAERDGPAGQLGLDLLFYAQTVIHLWHRVRDGTMSRRRFRRTVAGLGFVIELLLERGALLRVKGVSGSCADILDYKAALWTFVDHEGVEPTNNHAERELRGFVIWRKKCFGSQSLRGTRFAARLLTVTHTLRKQKRHVLTYLSNACRAAILGRPPPSLLPSLAKA